MKIYEIIKAKNNDHYSVIFEDDFDLSDNFIKILHESLHKNRNRKNKV
jgi:GR25 family glycosyltransferase involved in LPS biosynthesis